MTLEWDYNNSSIVDCKWYIMTLAFFDTALLLVTFLHWAGPFPVGSNVCKIDCYFEAKMTAAVKYYR